MRWQIEVWRCPRCHSPDLDGRVMGLAPFVYCRSCRSAWPQALPRTVVFGPAGVALSPHARRDDACEPVRGFSVDAVTPALRRLQETGDVVVVRGSDGRLEVIA